jgi:hypothetical protein
MGLLEGDGSTTSEDAVGEVDGEGDREGDKEGDEEGEMSLAGDVVGVTVGSAAVVFVLLSPSCSTRPPATTSGEAVGEDVCETELEKDGEGVEEGDTGVTDSLGVTEMVGVTLGVGVGEGMRSRGSCHMRICAVARSMRSSLAAAEAAASASGSPSLPRVASAPQQNPKPP